MRIAFYCQLLLKGNKTGIGWCANNIISTLTQEYDEEFYVHYFSKGVSETDIQKLKVFSGERVQETPCCWFKGTWYKLLWLILSMPYSAFFGKSADITQFFNFVIPPGVAGKKVTIVHDMTNYVWPETVSRKTRIWLKMTLRSSCKRADKIITVSEFSKKEIQKYLGISDNKIRVMYPGIDFSHFHPYTQAQIDEVKIKYGIHSNYFLYLGTIEPRKNLERLIQAYEMLAKEYSEIPQLVLAGGKGWLCDGIYKKVAESPNRNDILFTGYISDEDTAPLIAGAIAFCFPSIYEGFGSPPLEAMACGTPVLSSNVASMPEILGDAAVLVDPFSISSIKEGMDKLFRDESLRHQMIKKGLVHARKYSWKTSARTLMNVYQELMSEDGI